MRTLLLLLWLALPCSAAEKLVLVAGGEKANFKEPFGLDFLPDGSVVLVEFVGQKVRHIDKDGKVLTFAGTGEKGLVNGPADKSKFNGPHNLAVAKDGTIYVADSLNNVIRKIDAKTKMVGTIAGTGKKGFAGDGGPAKDAEFNQTFHVALDKEQANLYVVDLGNVRVRKIDLKSEMVTTVAGNGKKAVPKDGATAADTPLVDPRSCALDSKGRLYILERGGHALRVVEDGKIRTVIGAGTPTPTIKLNGPKLIWVDKNDDVLIADAENNRVRKYLAKDRDVVEIAGTGVKGDKGLDGDPKKAEVARPHGVAEGPDGTIWIVDSYNSRLLKIVK